MAVLAPGRTMATVPASEMREGDSFPAYPLASPAALHLSPKASEAAQAFIAFLNEGGGRVTPLPATPKPIAAQQPEAEADLAAWATARAAPVGLISLCVTAVAVALGSLGVKCARHRDKVMRRYRA